MLVVYIACVLALLSVPVIRTSIYTSRLQKIASCNYNALRLFLAVYSDDWSFDVAEPGRKQGHTFRLVFSYCGALKVCYLTYVGKDYYNKALKRLLEAWNNRETQ